MLMTVDVDHVLRGTRMKMKMMKNTADDKEDSGRAWLSMLRAHPEVVPPSIYVPFVSLTYLDFAMSCL